MATRFMIISLGLFGLMELAVNVQLGLLAMWTAIIIDRIDPDRKIGG